MTTRLKGLVVHFENNIDEDDAKQIIAAIQMIKGVGKVKFIEAGYSDQIIYERVRRELSDKIWNVLHRGGK